MQGKGGMIGQGIGGNMSMQQQHNNLQQQQQQHNMQQQKQQQLNSNLQQPHNMQQPSTTANSSGVFSTASSQYSLHNVLSFIKFCLHFIHKKILIDDIATRIALHSFPFTV